MQQTFEVNTGQLSQIFDAVIAKFGNRKVKVMIEDIPTQTSLNEAEELALLDRIQWEGDETGDELNAMLQSSRHFGSRDIEL